MELCPLEEYDLKRTAGVEMVFESEWQEFKTVTDFSCQVTGMKLFMH